MAAMSSTTTAADALVAGFRTPPQAAQPRVWWHWMNGNVTEEGIRLDFEWMKRVGIGGVQNFDAAIDWGAAFDTPPQVEKPLAYLTPEWRHAFRYSVTLAGELGLELAIAASPGFSETGGPWVEPAQAMKKLVWSETRVTGGAPFKGRLAQPPQTTGLFQNIPYTQVAPRLHGGGSWETAVHYADVATIAYRAPASEVAEENLAATVTSSAGAIDAARLRDGDLAQPVLLPFGENRQSWVQWAFSKPQRIQAISAVIGRPASLHPLLEANPVGWLEASTDGATFRKVADLPTTRILESSALQQTVSFAPLEARVFRVVLQRPGPGLFEKAGYASAKAPQAHQIAELVLHTAARVNRFEDKAGFSTRQIVEEDDTRAIAASDAVPRGGIVDLTKRMRSDGSVDWTPPAGRWIVLRFGYSLTGRPNHPASRAGTGLEVDKLSRTHVRTYMEKYLAEYEKTLGTEGIGRRGLPFVLTDSYEAAAQNWTEDMLEQFSQRRGYDALPWLPVLAGRVIENAVASDRLLWDFRKTLGELLAEAHYGQISASLRERGMGRYGESHEFGRGFVGDGMAVKKTADIPMGAMWATAPPVLSQEEAYAGYDADIRESASVAHIYGRNLVAAESFTVCGVKPHGFAPQDLKPIADRMMVGGLNRFVIHTSAHQPDSKPGPGIGLGPCGQWFTRKETWAEQAGSWISYLARSSFLLQQGRFVADIAYLYGEDTNITSLARGSAVPVPAGFNFDFINADALLSEVSVRNGRLVTRSGMEYRVLALDASTRRLSLPVLRRIRELVRAGAVVVGDRPATTPSLTDDERAFQTTVAELWGEDPGARSVGSGRVFANRSLAEALRTIDVSPDAMFPADADLHFVHRLLPEGDLYFVSSRATQARRVEASFRVSDKKPELWRADTGTIAPLSYRIENGRTIVPLRLESNDAVFVVFREPAGAPSAFIPEPVIEVLATLQGPWDVSFPSGLAVATHARFETPHSWTDSADPAVKYFSGTATYTRNLRIPRAWLKAGSRLRLELGDVRNLAEVLVNGSPLGVLWKPPFAVDMTEAVKRGDNRIEIRVTNLWPNRLIGEKQPGARQIAFATFNPFEADSPLPPSGLLGPVTLSRVRTQ